MNRRLAHLKAKYLRRCLPLALSCPLAMAIAHQSARPTVAQDANPPAAGVTQGRLGTLPGVEGATANSDALSGHVKLLERRIDRAIEDLQNGDLKSFLVSYSLMIDQYVEVADQLGDASESIGEAMAQVIVARKTLQSTIQSADESTSTERTTSTAEVSEMRDFLHGKIAAVRARLDAARPEDRDNLLVELQVLVERAEQLEQMAKAVETTGRPLLPGMASSELESRLTEVEQALEEEKRMIGLVAGMAHDVTKSAAKDLRSTMRYLEIDARIPRDQLDKLQKIRGNTQNTVRQIESTRDDTRRTVMGILLSNSTRSTKKVPAEELLQRADRLIKRPGTTTGSASAEAAKK